jgi:Tfp pilus assembly protein PilN
MSHLAWLLVVWGVLTAILIVLLIYKSTLSMREDDQLFLDESESHMAQEQVEVLRKMSQIAPLVRLFGAASGVLILVIAGIWIYQGFTQVQ